MSTGSPSHPEETVELTELHAKFEGIPVSTLALDSVVPFDLFTEIDGSSFLYRSAGDRFTKEQRNSLIESGMLGLLVRRADIEAYYDYLASNLLALLKGPPGQTPDPNDVLDTSTMAAGRVIDQPTSPRAFEMACLVIDNAIDLTGQAGGVLHCITARSPGLRALQGHSMRVCFYGLQLAHGIGIVDPEELADLGVGLMLHDLGKVKTRGIESSDPSVISDHPHIGLDRLQEAPFVGPIARDVIGHHHERVDGSGLYGVSSEDLSIHARIAAVADGFDRRTVNASGRTIANSFEALRAMIAEERGAYDPKLLALFVRALSL